MEIRESNGFFIAKIADTVPVGKIQKLAYAGNASLYKDFGIVKVAYERNLVQHTID